MKKGVAEETHKIEKWKLKRVFAKGPLQIEKWKLKNEKSVRRGNEKIEKWKLKSEKKVSENSLEDILTWNLSLRILMHK